MYLRTALKILYRNHLHNYDNFLNPKGIIKSRRITRWSWAFPGNYLSLSSSGHIVFHGEINKLHIKDLLADDWEVIKGKY